MLTIVGKIEGDAVEVHLPIGSMSQESLAKRVKEFKQKHPNAKFYLTWIVEEDYDQFRLLLAPKLEKHGIKWHYNSYTGYFEIYLQEL